MVDQAIHNLNAPTLFIILLSQTFHSYNLPPPLKLLCFIFVQMSILNLLYSHHLLSLFLINPISRGLIYIHCFLVYFFSRGFTYTLLHQDLRPCLVVPQFIF